MSCTGCSVSFLNVDSPGPVEILTELFRWSIIKRFPPRKATTCKSCIDQLTAQGDYYVIVEGAVPLNMPKACVMGGKPASTLLPPILKNAKAIVAVGTCAAYGGIPRRGRKLSPRPAAFARSWRVVQFPWKDACSIVPAVRLIRTRILGALAYVISKGYPKVDPKLLTPDMLYKHSVHDECPRFHYWGKEIFAKNFGDEGCLFKLGCLGPLSRTHCPRSQWNGGINWCIRAGAPCTACTSESFAKKSDFPFYRKSESYHPVNYSESERRGS